MSNIKKLSDEQKVVSAAAVLHTFDRFREELLKHDSKSSEQQLAEMRYTLVGILEMTPEAGGTVCNDHVVGHLKTELMDCDLTASQFLREIRRQPGVMGTYFKRYRFCPTCGHAIRWDDEEGKN